VRRAAAATSGGTSWRKYTASSNRCRNRSVRPQPHAPGVIRVGPPFAGRLAGRGDHRVHQDEGAYRDRRGRRPAPSQCPVPGGRARQGTMVPL
jgi:hypothetical protein